MKVAQCSIYAHFIPDHLEYMFPIFRVYKTDLLYFGEFLIYETFCFFFECLICWFYLDESCQVTGGVEEVKIHTTYIS